MTVFGTFTGQPTMGPESGDHFVSRDMTPNKEHNDTTGNIQSRRSGNKEGRTRESMSLTVPLSAGLTGSIPKISTLIWGYNYAACMAT